MLRNAHYYVIPKSSCALSYYNTRNEQRVDQRPNLGHFSRSKRVYWLNGKQNWRYFRITRWNISRSIRALVREWKIFLHWWRIVREVIGKLPRGRKVAPRSKSLENSPVVHQEKWTGNCFLSFAFEKVRIHDRKSHKNTSKIFQKITGKENDKK